MKKTIVVFLIGLFVFALTSFVVANAEQGAMDPGLYLKKVGIVKGFPDGSLNENAYITQAEYLSLLSRTLKTIKTVKRGNLVKQRNFFDVLINKAYHGYLILKYKIAALYYKADMYFSFKKRDADKNEWYFKDIAYLKINGFSIPEDFRPDAVISEGYAAKWAMDALGLGQSSEYVARPEDVNRSVEFFVLSVEHNMALDGINTAKPLKRRDAFDLILHIINNPE